MIIYNKVTPLTLVRMSTPSRFGLDRTSCVTVPTLVGMYFLSQTVKRLIRFCALFHDYNEALPLHNKESMPIANHPCKLKRPFRLDG